MDAVMENLRLSSLTQRDGPLFNIIVFVGLISSISLLARLVSFALPFVKPSGLRRYLHTTAGRPAWALVTGATDGIGKQIARELAGHGFNVVLHGRNPAKLSGCRGELARDFPGREFRALVADASAVPCAGCQAGPAGPATRSHDGVGGDAGAAPVDFDAIAASLADLNLTVLVNNVGGNPYPPVYQYLQDNAASKLTANNHLNALFPLILQSKLIPSLLRNSPSLIMNIGSMSDVGIPMLSAYCPTKASVIKVTEVLARELAMQGRSKDLEVIGMRVGEVCGTVYNKSTPSLFEPDAKTMARAALARVGCGKIVVVGYFWHAIQEASLIWMPGWATELAIRSVVQKRWRADQELNKRA